MRKWIITVLLITCCCASSILAQEDEYHKFEVSGGYSSMRVDGILGDGELFADDQNEELTTIFPPITNNNLMTNPGNFFPPEAMRYSGNRKRRQMHGFNASAVYNFSKYVGAKVEVSGHFGSGAGNLTGVSFGGAQEPIGSASQCAALGFPNLSSCGRLLPPQSTYPTFTVRAVIASVGFGSYPSDRRHYNFLGGLQLKNNSKEKKFKPFAHALAGVSRQTVQFKDFGKPALAAYDTDKFTNTGFTMAFGGGIDIRLSKRIDLRVIQVDYNPVRIKGQQIVEFKQPLANFGSQTGIPNNITFVNIETATLYSISDVRINSRWQNNFRFGVGIVFH